MEFGRIIVQSLEAFFLATQHLLLGLFTMDYLR